MEMTREEKVRFIRKSAWYFEGIELKKEDFITKSDSEIDEEVEKYNYLWEK